MSKNDVNYITMLCKEIYSDASVNKLQITEEQVLHDAFNFILELKSKLCDVQKRVSVFLDGICPCCNFKGKFTWMPLHEDYVPNMGEYWCPKCNCKIDILHLQKANHRLQQQVIEINMKKTQCKCCDFTRDDKNDKFVVVDRIAQACDNSTSFIVNRCKQSIADD